MATVTIEGSRNLVYVDLNVSESSYDISSNTSNLSYSVVIRKGSKSWNTSWASWGQKIYVSYSIHGNNYTTYIPTYNYNGQVPPGSTIASGTINNVSHNADGTKSIAFGISLTDNANGKNSSGTYYTPGNASWKETTLTLTTIPRQANLTSAPNFNDEQNPTIGYSNSAGNSVTSLQACISFTGSTDDIVYRDIPKTGSSYTFNLTSAERTKLRNATTNSNSRSVIFYVKTVIGGNTFYSTLTKTLSIINANPTFNSSQLSYQDTNSNIVAITRNNQHIVRNNSTLQVTFTGASPNKGASINRYEVTLNGSTQTKYGASTINYGAVNISQNVSVSVKVIDSRGNSTTISKTITILNWVNPTATISLGRVNNYENTTNLKAVGTISSVNSKNAIQLIRYRYKKTSDGTYSSWTSISNNTQYTISLDKEYAWNFQFEIQDKFGSTTYNIVLAKGMPIMFIDIDKLAVGVNCFPTTNNSLALNGQDILEYEVVDTW